MRHPRGLIGPLVAALGAWLVFRDRLDVVEVRGRSMLPALRPGDRLLVARADTPPGPGAIVLAPDPRDPSRELVKRVVSVDETGVVVGGDNPGESTDARTFGALPVASVRWRVVLRYWPIARAGPIRRI
jgi:nickel-type superoxide dismutase maturation protease